MQYSTLVALSWAVFLAVWGAYALRAKRTVNAPSTSLSWWRIVAVFAVFIALNFSGFHINISYRPTDVVGSIGVLICALGIAFAVWARIYLASNWGMPMSVKESPELITTGPYAYIRHPIYTGVLLAMLGSALVTGPVWGIVMLLFGGYFIYSALQEEKLLIKEFPEQYQAYKSRSKMLIPFIL
jgi:protein-S-isoprenylcysteine O-methyltransferase Ste14